MEGGGGTLKHTNMNSDDDKNLKEGLLDGKDPMGGVGRRSHRLSRWYSLNSIRSDFVARLPDKVKSCVDLESCSPQDLSKASGLTRGWFFLLSSPFLVIVFFFFLFCDC